MVPVEFACHNKCTVCIGDIVVNIGVDLLREQLFSGRQVPRDACTADGRGDGEDLRGRCLNYIMQAGDHGGNTPLNPSLEP